MTLLELSISVTLFVVIFLASVTLIERDRELSRSAVHMANIEHQAQQMLFRLEHELANAFGVEPVAVLPVGLDAGATASMQIDSSLGFPPRGTVVVSRGTPEEERIAYGGLDATQDHLLALERGQQCTEPQAHAIQAEVLWSGLAEPLEQQVPPPDPEDWDGVAMETSGPVYYRGDGIGFSYRVPVDPAGGTDYLDGDDLKWGAELPGVGPTLDGRIALYFEPRTEYDESWSGDDLNGDGDTDDVYDVGQIRRVVWDASDPAAPPSDVGMGPSNVLQERCAWGSDLDADGWNDPIFLWDPKTNELHVRLFLLGASVSNAPVTRMVESVLFLRNEPEL